MSTSKLAKQTDFVLQMIHNDPQLSQQFYQQAGSSSASSMVYPQSQYAAGMLPGAAAPVAPLDFEQTVYFDSGVPGVPPVVFVNSVGPLVTVKMNETVYRKMSGLDMQNGSDNEEAHNQECACSADIF